MAKKVSDIEEIKQALKDKKAVVGTERVLKELKKAKLSKIYAASNCREETLNSTMHDAKLQNVEVLMLKQPNDELGVLCKKPFLISIIGISK